MSETEKYCTSCKKNLNITEFTLEGKIFKTCNICKQQKINKRSIKNTCEECGIHACFNFTGENFRIRCKKHKEIGMINVKSKTCEHEGCKIQPIYNFEGEIKAKFCNEHKEIGMIDVKSKTCEHEGCKIQPIYNFEGLKGKFCNEHKEIGMVNVKDKTCEHEGCKTRANFGYINQIAVRCARHKLPLMFKNRKSECQEENCFEISEYGIEEPTHCYLHQKNNHLCLLGQKCKKCNRDNELCNKEQICLTYCRPTELSIIAKKIIKKKEGLVLAYLDKYIKTDIIPVDDRIIDNSCVRRRPDRLYDCGSYFVVVEIDENQHKNGYYNGCTFDLKKQEYRRMAQILEALSLPVIFIRFNPDSFKIKGKKQIVNMQKRLDTLEKWVSKCINLKWILGENESSIRIKHLFYDEYNDVDIKFEEPKDINDFV